MTMISAPKFIIGGLVVVVICWGLIFHLRPELKRQQLERDFTTSLPTYPSSEFLTSRFDGCDLCFQPSSHEKVYKISPQVTAQMIRDFYADYLTQRGWEIAAADTTGHAFRFYKGVNWIYLDIGCVNNDYNPGHVGLPPKVSCISDAPNQIDAFSVTYGEHR